MDVESKVRQAKRDALTSFLMGEQSLVPTAKVDVGGITQTVPAGVAPTAMADIQSQAYNEAGQKFQRLCRIRDMQKKMQIGRQSKPQQAK